MYENINKNKRFFRLKKSAKKCVGWYSRDDKSDGLCEMCGKLYKHHLK